MADKRYNFVVIGSGIAGLTAAILLSKIGKVAVITKDDPLETNTFYAQGGIAAVLSPDDNFEEHIEDTINAGWGLSDLNVVKIVVESAPKVIKFLEDQGVPFNKIPGDGLDLGREAGHSKNRIVHYYDLTGEAIQKTLLERIVHNKNIDLYSYHIVIDFIREEDIINFTFDNDIYGIYALDVKKGKILKFLSDYTILASGGGGNIYTTTTNPSVATGDGFALSFFNSLSLGNMEFVQFHPTAFYTEEGRSFLITEAIRGKGAIVRDSDGYAFLKDYDPRAELAPRDIVAKAIDSHLKKRGEKYVFLDATVIGERVKKEFPKVYNYCISKGIDITKDWIPIKPAAHYFCGGVKVDINGKTEYNRLFATGEVAYTGLHGANRLASNSLLEALVFSHNIFDYIKNNFIPLKTSNNIKVKNFISYPSIFDANMEKILISHEKETIKNIMTDLVGIVRNNYRLEKAKKKILEVIQEIEEIYKTYPISKDLIEVRFMGITSYAIIESALKRKESRGLHYNTDYPNKDDKNWKKPTFVNIKEFDEVKVYGR